MEDPLSAASELATLSGFALQASELLYQTIGEFRTSKRAARQLRDEVQTLSQTLEVLERVAAEYEVELLILKLPLIQCAAACKGLSDRIDQHIKHSHGSNTSLEDWTSLQYLGEDITNYKNVLANYKETINIALGGATFQSAVATHQVLEKYKELIGNTTIDLHDRLDQIERKLSTNLSLTDSDGIITRDDMQKIEDERHSIKHCLNVCKKVSAHIEQNQPKREHDIGEAAGVRDTTSQANSKPRIAQQIAPKYLDTFIQDMFAASSRLQGHLNEVEEKLQSSKDPTLSDKVAGDIRGIKEQRETIGHYLNICADASNFSDRPRVNIFEDVKSSDDTQQVLASTVGYLLNAKQISTGARSLQLLGQMSDETLRHYNSRQSGTHEDAVVGVEEKKGKNHYNMYGIGRSLRNGNPAREAYSLRSTP